jgi:hypothetical protein
VKPRPFCIFLASAEAFLSRPVRRTFWPDGGLGSQKKPFPEGSPTGWLRARPRGRYGRSPVRISRAPNEVGAPHLSSHFSVPDRLLTLSNESYLWR